MPPLSGEEKPKSPDAAQNNPWSIDRPKPKSKETTGFSFGALEDDAKKDENFDFMGASKPKQGDSFDFMGGIKSAEKKNASSGFSWGTTPAKTADDDFWGSIGSKKSSDEGKPAHEEASDDIWAFSSSKKDVSAQALNACAMTCMLTKFWAEEEEGQDRRGRRNANI